ncbi:MAG: hypothetical protein GX421_04465 [Caldisericales bacterium]|nr:hypothetical protein [Caldisericales bacterium]
MRAQATSLLASSLLFLALLSGCGGSTTVKTEKFEVKKSYEIIPKIASCYPVYDGAFENEIYGRRFEVRTVAEKTFGVEASGTLFASGDPAEIFTWYMQKAKVDGWGKFEGGTSYVPYDAEKGYGFLAISKGRRTLSLEFRRKPGWEYTRIQYLGMAYHEDGAWLDDGLEYQK